MPELIFVYNADSGLFNTLADIGHKLFSPETYACELCMLTHGTFREKAEWRAFVEALPLSCRFLHRDQFHAEWPQVDTRLPAVFVADGEQLRPCLDAAALRGCDDLESLKSRIRDCLAAIADQP